MDVPNTIPPSTSKDLSGVTIALLVSAGLSVLLSLSFQFAKKNDEALFVGQWPPTLATLAVFTHLCTLNAAT